MLIDAHTRGNQTVVLHQQTFPPRFPFLIVLHHHTHTHTPSCYVVNSLLTLRNAAVDTLWPSPLLSSAGMV